LPVVFPRGPRLYDQPWIYESGPGNPPTGFVTATTSGSEWVLYWAIWKVLGVPGDVREEPFSGRPTYFSFQRSFSGGREEIGGAVADFVVYGGRGRLHDSIIIRLQTEHFHRFTNVMTQARDARQAIMLQGAARLIDIEEVNILGDQTGEKACRHVAEVLSGTYLPNPMESSTQRRLGSGWRPIIPR
jgi:hypothetical protein